MAPKAPRFIFSHSAREPLPDISSPIFLQDRARLFQSEVEQDKEVHYTMQQQGQHQRWAALLAAEEAVMSGERDSDRRGQTKCGL